MGRQAIFKKSAEERQVASQGGAGPSASGRRGVLGAGVRVGYTLVMY